jgi:hypothetical protein
MKRSHFHEIRPCAYYGYDFLQSSLSREIVNEMRKINVKEQRYKEAGRTEFALVPTLPFY